MTFSDALRRRETMEAIRRRGEWDGEVTGERALKPTVTRLPASREASRHLLLLKDAGNLLPRMCRGIGTGSQFLIIRAMPEAHVP